MQVEAQVKVPRHKRSKTATGPPQVCMFRSLARTDERMPPDAPLVDGKTNRGPNGGPSHKQVGSRGRLSIVLDNAVLSMFEEERRARGLTISKLVSIILWNRYGCPKLSFE